MIIVREAEVITSAGFIISVRHNKDHVITVQTHDGGVLPVMTAMDGAELAKAIAMVSNALKAEEV